VSKVPCPAIGSLGRDGIGVCARRKQLDRGVQICEIRPLARNPFFEVVKVAADFSTLEAKGGCGSCAIIPGILRKSGRCAKNCPQERSKISQLQDNSLQNETGN